jgi:hypothetical protein
MAKHSQLGASNTYRWWECPGSVALCEQVPDKEPSEYAKKGTMAHELICERFKDQEKDIEIPDQLDSEDVEAINFFLDFVDEERAKGKYLFYNEIKFSLDRIMSGLWGTCDVVLASTDLKKLVVIDYKHGAGVPVEVEGNKQLLYYALGAIQEIDAKHAIGSLDVLGWGGVFKEVEIVIVQPRCRHKDGKARRWTVPSDELEKFAEELKNHAELALKPNSLLYPGEHCRFCPASAVCPAMADKALMIAQTDFQAISAEKAVVLPQPEILTKAELAKILAFAPVLEGWLKDVEGHALALLERGEEVPGFKLVKKRAFRAWRSEEEAANTLALYLTEDQLWERKILSPAKVDKLLKKDKKIVADLVVTPDNGNTIAADYDPREQVKASVEADFAKLTTTNIEKEK